MSFLDRLLGRVTDRAVNRNRSVQLQPNRAMSVENRKREASLNELRIAFEKQDSRAVEVALADAFRNGLSVELVPILIDLCRARWHMSHEDVVSALQKVGDVAAVDAIEEVAYADLPYLDYDEHFGLARKATWALADIGGPVAKEALHRIAASRNPLKAVYASKRIQNWELELKRKRNSAKLNVR